MGGEDLKGMVEELQVDDSHASNVHLQLHWLLSRWGVAHFFR